MQHIMNNVEALWPRINTTYKYDSQESKSVRCDPKDPAAAYEMSFRMTAAQAKELWGKMVEAYNSKKQAGWPDLPNNPLKEDEGCYIGKAKLKGNYNGELTKGVAQYDSSGNKLSDDFMLTTGSKVNVAITFVPYNMREAGVSLRLRAVQVVEYKEMEDANPFGAVNGFTAQKEDNPFGLPPTQAEPQKPPFDPDMGDEIPF